MFLLIYAITLVTATIARPDVAFLNNNGYQYQQQQQQITNNKFMKSAVIPMQQELPSIQQSINFRSNFDTDIEPQMAIEPARQAYQTPGYTQFTQDSYQAAYQHSGIPHQSGYANAAPQTQVHKHVYVHVPPKDFEDEDSIQPHVYHQAGPKQKHYKIVFIKTPTPPSVRPPIVAPAPQPDEKTLIYVLHKKPNMHQEIVIPTAAPQPPSKPEVFFIKYKSKPEAAPVYGPPPGAVGSDPRHAAAAEPAAEYIPPTSATANEEHAVEMTTVSTVTSDYLPPPTMPSKEEVLPPAPNAQYLPSNEVPLSKSAMTGEEVQASAARYGPPNKFFFKH